jgi:hypothetical protein
MRTLLLVLFALVATATPATAATPLSAGTPLTSSTGGLCSNGFNVKGHLLVSPSCGGLGATVKGPGGGVVGPVIATRPTYSVVKIGDPAQWVQLPGIVGRPGSITGSVESPVGAAVCAAGRTSGWRCGTVQAKNVTVSYPGGTVTGLTRTSLCAQPGDEWGAVVAGTHAQGHLLGASNGGACATYFYPLNRILAAEGFTLVT